MLRFTCFVFVAILIISPAILRAQDDSDSDETREVTGGVYPTEAQGPDTNQIQPNRQAIGNFGKIEAPVFTKEMHIASQTQNETKPNYYVMDGYVDLIYEGVRLQADHAEYDAASKNLIATGNVVLDQEGQHLTGDKLDMNLETKLGTMYNARGYFPPQIFFWGEKLEKIGEYEYKLYDGVFTECSEITPHWRLNTTTARLTLDEYVHFKNFTLRAKNVPIFYSPYMMWPIKRDRATGFLFPSFGPNNNKGFWVGGSFFWAMTKSMDSTYWLDHYGNRGFGGGVEYRYAVSKESDGSLKTYYVDDSVIGGSYEAQGLMKQELPGDFSLRATVHKFSSIDYIKDYSGSLSSTLAQTNIVQAFLTKNWSYYSLNVLGEDQAKLSQSGNTSSFFHIPEVEFRSRDQKLGPTPFFGNLLTSFSTLGRSSETADNVTNRFQFQRYDFFPNISYPITYLSWLTLTPSYGYRLTHYTSSRQPPEGVVDESVTRGYSDFSLDIRGPNFGKIFDTPNWGYSKKWKHAIEPQVTFSYVQDIPENGNILVIDPEIDSILGARQVTYSLTNLLYAKRPIKEQKDYEPDEYQYYKPVVEEDLLESAWELVSWRISQSYFFKSESFDPESSVFRKPFSPISSLLRINPAQNYNIQFTANYDVNFHTLTGATLGATLKNTEKFYANLSYGYNKSVTDNRSANSLQTNGGVGFWKNRLVLTGEFSAQFSSKEVLNRAAGITWNDDCFSIGVEYRYFGSLIRANGQKESQITFNISLPNIGSLVNYQSGANPKRF